MNTEYPSIMPPHDWNDSISGCESWPRQLPQVLLLLIVAAGIFATGIGRLALTDPDEGRYALIGQNMVDRHNYLEPWLGGEYYSKKPILYFTLLAESFRLVGTDNVHFSARIVSVTGATLTILAAYLVASTLFGHTIGLISASALLSTVVMIGFGKFVRMDIYLVAWMTLALWAFLKGYKKRGPSRWFLLMYPLLGLGVLTKGPVAMIIPFVVIFLFLLWQRLIGQEDGRILNHLRLILGLAIIIVIAGPWYLYMVAQHADYALKFFWQENWERGMNMMGSFGHHYTPLIYLAVVLVGMMPWTGLGVLAVARYVRSAWSRGSRDWESRFLFLWLIVVLGFFSVSFTRLLHYVLPAFIPVSIYLGRFLYDYWQSDFPRRRRQITFAWAHPAILIVATTVVALYVLAAGGSAWFQFHGRWTGLPDLYQNPWWNQWGWLVSLGYRLAAGALLLKLFWSLWRNWKLTQLAIAVTVAFLLLMVDVSYTDLPRAADLVSCRRLAPLVKKYYNSGTVILEGPVTENQRWSLPFYLGKDYPITYLRHLADFADYYKKPGRMIYLSHDDYAFNQVRLTLGPRVTVLARYGETRLTLIKEKEVHLEPDLSTATRPARPVP